jgi:hypothetical protein
MPNPLLAIELSRARAESLREEGRRAGLRRRTASRRREKNGRALSGAVGRLVASLALRARRPA